MSGDTDFSLWATNDSKVNPAAATILADTGPLDAGCYQFSAWIAASSSDPMTPINCLLRWTDNTPTMKFQQYIPVQVRNTNPISTGPVVITVAQNDHFDIKLVTNLAVRTVTDAAITIGLKVLTSATATFTAGDVGHRVSIVGATAQTAGAGGPNGVLDTIIDVFTNSTTVTIHDAAGLTVSGASASISSAIGGNAAPVNTTVHATILVSQPWAS